MLYKHVVNNNARAAIAKRAARAFAFTIGGSRIRIYTRVARPL